MTIASILRKTLIEELPAKVEAKIGKECRVPRTNGLGMAYLAKVVEVFTENLPEDETDIHAHIKARNDERWGVDTDSVLPYSAAHTAIDLGLLGWDYTGDKTTTAGMILVDHLRAYTSVLVTVLCEAAIEAWNYPEAQYVAHINVPGYSPMADEPAEFETAQEAWEYLADERRDSEVAAEDGGDDGSETLHRLVANMRLSESVPVCDVVYGPTPGYDGNHDLGLAYSVVPVEN